MAAAQVHQVSPSDLFASAQSQSKHPKKKAIAAEKPSPQPSPAFSIAVGPLGFAPPSLWYMGGHTSQVTLDFLDETTLLFTFRIPGLIARDHSESDKDDLTGSFQERNIRALVLSLPSGKITAEATWRLHDFSAYLWMLKDHRFILRDRNLLQFGDTSLNLTPFLRFRGPVRYIDLDPNEQFLVAGTVEPIAPGSQRARSRSALDLQLDPGWSSNGVATAVSTDPGTMQPATENLLRILRIKDGQVAFLSRPETDSVVHLPVDGEGYYDALRGNGRKWLISYEHFSGAANPILEVESTCHPRLDALAPGFVLASGCLPSGERQLTVVSRDKRRLWDVSIAPTHVWPILARAADAPRLARATLDVTHPIGPSSPLSETDIRGQSVQVYDLADGKLELTVPVSPTLDGGGSFALSPSGMRFATLNAGAIQVYELPPVPPLPQSTETEASKP